MNGCMPPQYSVMVAFLLCTFLAEATLWMLFSRRAKPLDFPKQVDWSNLHFFTLGRMRAIAVVHGAVMMGAVIAVFLFLW